MSRDPVVARIKRILKKEFGDKQDQIIVRNGFEEILHLYIISKKFKKVPTTDRGDLIWSLLFSELQDEEWGRITLVMGLTPNELDKVQPWEPDLKGVRVS